MTNIQIKNVPTELHDELRRRAHQEGKTIRDYVLELITDDQLLPSARDWLEEVRSLEPVDLTGVNVAEVVRAGRAEGDGRRSDPRQSRER